eukprot:6197968-Pleurochrysis_carterae.AAC.2
MSWSLKVENLTACVVRSQDSYMLLIFSPSPLVFEEARQSSVSTAAGVCAHGHAADARTARKYVHSKKWSLRVAYLKFCNTSCGCSMRVRLSVHVCRCSMRVRLAVHGRAQQLIVRSRGSTQHAIHILRACSVCKHAIRAKNLVDAMNTQRESTTPSSARR